jgi:thioredoxin 1
MIIKVTKQNYEEVMASKGTVILDFYANWCGPCKLIAPHLEDLSKELDIVIGKIDCDEEMALANKYSIVSIPTLIIIKDGKEVNKVVGYRTKDELLKLI